MSCLAAIIGFFLFMFGFVVFGLGELCDLVLYLVGQAAGMLAPFL